MLSSCFVGGLFSVIFLAFKSSDHQLILDVFSAWPGLTADEPHALALGLEIHDGHVGDDLVGARPEVYRRDFVAGDGTRRFVPEDC